MMEVRFNLAGAERKPLVEAISEIVGSKAVYMRAPTYGYEVQSYTIDKKGTLICDEGADSGAVHSLLTELVARGFVYEDNSGEDAPADELLPEDSRADEYSGALPGETAAPADAPDHLVVEVPLDGFTATALDNLDKLVASKADLIKKALGAPDLPIVREDDRLCFPWFTLGASGSEVTVYTQFIFKLCEMAKTQKRVVAKEKPAESEKFAFRCFLLRLGYIGHEYGAARKLLLANLPGDGSFKSGKRKVRDEDSEAAVQGANAADSGADAWAESSAGEGSSAADSTVTGDMEGSSDPNSLAETLADAELIHGVNALFDSEMV